MKDGIPVWVWEEGTDKIFEGRYAGELDNPPERVKDYRLVEVDGETRMFHMDHIKETLEEAEKTKKENYRKKVDHVKSFMPTVETLVDRMLFHIICSPNVPSAYKEAMRERAMELHVLPEIYYTKD